MSTTPTAEADVGQIVKEISPTEPTTPPPQAPPSPQASPSSPKPTSATHISQVQPHASFFRVSRPNNEPASAAPRPRPSSFVSTSSGAHNRFLDAIHLSPLSRQLSLGSASDASSSVATRRSPFSIGVKHSREPLLPIGAVHRRGVDPSASDPATPSTSTGRMRGSLEKIFKRGTSADSLPGSPKTSPRPSPVQSKFATTDIEMNQPRSPPPVNDGYFNDQPSPRPPPPPSPQPSSRHPRFAPTPPEGTKAFVPHISPATGKPQRNYEGYPSQNIFFFRGHLLTGGDSPIPFIASFILALGISGTWFGTTCVWWWRDESPAVAAVGAYICLVTVASMLATALRDPGILPRNLDLDPPYPTSTPSDGSPTQPYPRDLRIGESVVRVKYCTTCKTYRPPRSSHCKACDNCIDGCDHHCQWVNNCIGRRNYTSFITFLVTASLALALVIVTAALHLYILTRRDHISFKMSLQTAPGSAVVFSLGFVVIWPLLALMGYHVRLLLLNVTTIEQVRNKVHATLIPGPAPPNPFSLGRWHRNMAYLLCRPAGYTWIEASAVRMEDKREINPGAYEDSDDEDGQV